MSCVPVNRLDIYLWDQCIGVLVLDPVYGYYAFAYTPECRASGIEPAPLKMPTGPRTTYLFTDLPTETYKRLPPLLSDALPNDFGNALINPTWLSMASPLAMSRRWIAWPT